MRFTVRDVATLADCSPYLVRRLANLGYLKCGRDYKNWRIFTDPELAARSIRQLLGENVADKESEEA